VLWSGGECIQGALINPMSVDLAPEAMLGRYLALASASWQVGFAVAPALSGFALKASATATWLVAAAVCVAAGASASLLEPRLPASTRRTPAQAPPLAAIETG
jgi:MFS family permease